ncbi:hypothetical protein L3V59_36250 [Burkholderia aenigmatica]|uniref:hypothetical protein n=1 Tax=Burkholderia aenigmatica TaxID=2015348 RepID=UPI001F32D2C1|nr:hypothetical protein [Burkholderia aenigmatica]UKD17398.1 hypothetical protein L3V59_36250 [Burkholderia aenigmatica]
MSTVQDDLPLNEAELAERGTALWRNELEWVRQHPRPDLADFHRLMEKELISKDDFRLPSIDVAMWPEDVFCNIDIGNEEKFNDRFIELPVGTRASGLEKWFWGAHNGFGIFALFFFLFSEEKEGALFLYFMVAVVFWPLIYFFTFRLGRVPMGRARYNRQAQLIHIDDGQGHMAHIPWRLVEPTVSLGVGPSAILRVCAPAPYAESEIFRLRMVGRCDAEKLTRLLEKTYVVPVTMTASDHAGMFSNLQRLEFWRRYMEHGLRAVQPNAEAIVQGRVVDTSDIGNPKEMLKEGWDAKYVLYPLDRLCHYLCLGPWLDKRARRRATEAFEWNDEVKNLCGPNPDLRGLDTRPVKSRTDIYYRPDAGGFRMVDRHGRPVLGGKATP